MAAIIKALPNVSATKAIFSDSSTGQSSSDSGNGGNSNSGSSQGGGEEQQKNIQIKEFFWDQFVIYLATAIALLTLLDISVQLLRTNTSSLSCFIPTEFMSNETTRDQAAYVNTYCQQSLSLNEYYSVFILIQGILLVAPHYLWSSVFSGRFDFFFDLVRQLDRLRDPNTGEYRPKNFDLVKKLEQEFPEKWKWTGIFCLYMLKLTAQFLIAFIALFVNVGLFRPQGFSFVFDCPESNSSLKTSNIHGWPFEEPVQCVYTSFRLLSKVLFVDYALLTLALITIGYGLVWCFKRHQSGLGYKKIARFAFTSSLSPYEYVHKRVSEGIKYLFIPRIKNDLDFLLMRLFRADSGHGRVFKDIQIYKELKRLLSEDHERLQLYIDAIVDSSYETGPNGGNTSDDRNRIREVFFNSGFNQTPETDVFNVMLGRKHLGNMKLSPIAGIRDRFFGFFQFCPSGNGIAYDISFGTIGYSLVLARAFQNVISINFNPYYRNTEKVCQKDKFSTNHCIIHLQDDIYAQSAKLLTASEMEIDDEMTTRNERGIVLKVYKANFLVVGPFTDQTRIATVNLQLERLNVGGFIAKNATLLTVRPLKIGHKDVSERFQQYIPPNDFFKENERVRQKLREDQITLEHVGKDCEGLKVTCDETECVFEFTVYEFLKGEGNDVIDDDADSGQPHDSGSESDVFPRNAPPQMPFQKASDGSIALILPASVLPQLDVSDLEHFLSGHSKLELSTGNDQSSNVRIVAKNMNAERSVARSVNVQSKGNEPSSNPWMEALSQNGAASLAADPTKRDNRELARLQQQVPLSSLGKLTREMRKSVSYSEIPLETVPLFQQNEEERHAVSHESVVKRRQADV